MKIVIAGGTGQVGTLLSRALLADGHEAVILTRRESVAGSATQPRRVHWDGRTMGDWTQVLEGAGVLVNLTGRSVNCRYTARNRRLIMDSRIDSTRVLGEALAQLDRPPSTWLQASTATIYAHRYDAPNDEATGILGGDEPDAPDTWRFSIGVATRWEQTAREACPPGVRQVLMRSAMTMSPDRGGVFDTLLTLVRCGLGGKHGDGRQYVSWIHEHDFVRAVYWLIEHPALEGPVNLAAPEPMLNAAFMRTLRETWGRRLGLPAARWMLEVGTVFMRSESELVLKSRRVVPGRLLDSGFTFTYPTWSSATTELCRRSRSKPETGHPAAQRRAA